MIVVGLLLISNAALLGQSLGTAMGMTVEGAKTFAIVLGVIGFWVCWKTQNFVVSEKKKNSRFWILPTMRFKDHVEQW